MARLRMYNVGFGDAFLLTLPTDAGERRILIDCGSVAKASKSIGDIAKAIVDHVTPARGKPRIDVVVATHRHRDHVAGFAVKLWEKVEVGEVWMPWTEHPSDPEAKRIRDKQIGLALALQRSLTATAGLAFDVDEVDNTPGRHPAYQMTLDAVPNEAAMNTLHNGFAGSPVRRFFPDEAGARVYRTDVLPGVKVHVLGPSRDESVIRDIDPPAGETYLRVAAGAATDLAASAPFASTWSVPPGDFKQAGGWPMLALDDDDIDKIEMITSDPETALAATLDKAINGTSLVLVFEIGRTCLLFPGDAQWGTWERILADAQWRALLGRTRLLKVGHHGSHNATPIDFVKDLLPAETWAMISTRSVSQWPDIPREPLLQALEGKGAKIVRSDNPTDALAGITRDGDLFTEIAVAI
jgi:beta-lactamase superfamily II metal-dependent hydrolase